MDTKLITLTIALIATAAAIYLAQKRLKRAAETTSTESFFPPDYKHFPFTEGDLLVSQAGSGKFSVNKVLKVDRVNLKAGDAINIQGQSFVAPVDDFLLIVSTSYGAKEFDSLEAATSAAIDGKWTVEMVHIPNRPPGAADGQQRVGWAAVTGAELRGYRIWKEAFDKNKAGVF